MDIAEQQDTIFADNGVSINKLEKGRIEQREWIWLNSMTACDEAFRLNQFTKSLFRYLPLGT